MDGIATAHLAVYGEYKYGDWQYDNIEIVTATHPSCFHFCTERMARRLRVRRG
jgi:hypothetical protein